MLPGLCPGPTRTEPVLDLWLLTKVFARVLRRGVGVALGGLLMMLGASSQALASEGLGGATLGLIWCGPFVGLLLSLAIIPATIPTIWHHNAGKIAAGWSLLLLVPLTISLGLDPALDAVLHVALSEYLPFLILVGTLYIITGGVQLKGCPPGTPAINTLFLAVGTLTASFTGTTGASMLLVRPLLAANAHRRHRTHLMVFLIFLVANIGGGLTPLGDPPIFLGFLQGVSFFWTTTHLLAPTLLASTLLLLLFFCVDSVLARMDSPSTLEASLMVAPGPLRVHGGVNLLLLAGVVGVVLVQGVWAPGVAVTVHGVPVQGQTLAANLALGLLALASLKLTPAGVREANGFGWKPIQEVAELFAAIFITIVPAIAILRAGSDGALAPLLALLTHDGKPVNGLYFWITGGLSSVLDNAPTYLIFFNAAGGNAAHLMTDGAATLAAISAGAVFMGANTYIGNAPNFMVRSIAEQSGVRMPSFFAYTGWALLVLMPLFALMNAMFFN